MAPLEPDKIYYRFHMSTYQHFLQEQDNKDTLQPYLHRALTVLDSITHISVNQREHGLTTSQEGYLPLRNATERLLYAELLRHHYFDHHSTNRWLTYFNTHLDWTAIWVSCHNPLSLATTVTVIWEQLHLNFYTTYMYNKWHQAQHPCPLCDHLPTSRMHLICECPLTLQLWSLLQPVLQHLTPHPATSFEMAFGLSGTTPSVLLRNWITFNLRELLQQQERYAYHSATPLHNLDLIKHALNRTIANALQDNFFPILAWTAYPHFLPVTLFIIFLPL